MTVGAYGGHTANFGGGKKGLEMEIDALLCDHAQVAGQKLFISGANINVFNIPPTAPGPFPISFALAGVVRVPWTATNHEHKLRFTLLDEDGKSPELAEGAQTPPEGIVGQLLFNVGRSPLLPTGDEQLVPFAFQFGTLPLAKIGKYSIDLELDGTPVRNLSFRLLRPPAAFGGASATSFGPIPGVA